MNRRLTNDISINRRGQLPLTRGFTVMEMMVVVTIVLVIITVTVPIFRVATKTVSGVERKLSLYAAARNILDTLEGEARLSAMNERGGRFALKKLAFQDTDKFTPTLATPDTIKFKYSRREADCLNFVQLQPGGFDWNGVVANRPVPVINGSQAHPLAYPNNWGRLAEGWNVQLTSTLSYQTPSVVDVDQMEGNSSTEITDQIADVAQISTPVHAFAISNFHKDNVTDGGYGSSIRMYDELYDILGPGKENKNTRRVQTEAYIPGRQHYRGISGIHVMDLDIAYWDVTQSKFVNPPDSTAIYFSRAPRALRFTITVCDREKRIGSVTLQRIVYLPAGTFKGPVTDSKDGSYYAYTNAGSAPTNPCKGTAFNRTKQLKNLPPMFNGDWVWDWGDGKPNVSVRYSEAPVSASDPGVFGTKRLWPTPPLPLNW